MAGQIALLSGLKLFCVKHHVLVLGLRKARYELCEGPYVPGAAARLTRGVQPASIRPEPHDTPTMMPFTL
jgi:hypothetical protein